MLGTVQSTEDNKAQVVCNLKVRLCPAPVWVCVREGALWDRDFCCCCCSVVVQHLVERGPGPQLGLLVVAELLKLLIIMSLHAAPCVLGVRHNGSCEEVPEIHPGL